VLIPSAVASIAIFTLLMMTYFAAWACSLVALGAVAVVFVRRFARRRSPRGRTLARHVSSQPEVSVIVPAFNEEVTIVQSVRALLALDYESYEVVVVNDGSSDGTLQVLQQAFQMLAAPVAFDQPLRSAPVRGVYRSVREPWLVLIDKEPGGSKSDALNAGINAASGVLTLMIDADTIIEPDALSRAVLPFLEDPHTVVVGANVGAANGCQIQDGRIVSVGLPRSWIARFQIVEYMRSFLLFRSALASVNALTLVSGAFGLFRRDLVIAVGGYDRRTIGEDMDLTMRVQEHCRRKGTPFRIAYDPFTLCSTQVPEDWSSLRAQRCRWRRGLLQSLWGRRRMIGNPRFGVLGLCVLPYVVVFEVLGPLLEVIGYAVTTMAVAVGLLSWRHYGLLLFASVLFGIAATLAAVLLSDIVTKRYMRGRDLGLLVAVTVMENFGYRQLNAWWSCVGTVQTFTKRRGWGVIQRRVFDGNVAVLPAGTSTEKAETVRSEKV
jgi:cellulose synthase/poly-beta-1,6-N-acetylglucosamine synthase-like glycosyltransferase